MRKIDESKYISYTIVGDGWQFTIYTWEKARSEWAGMKYGTLYGNKHDGSAVTIDCK